MAIILPGGFNITNNEPVDARITLADQTARYALSSANVYEGLIVFQQDNNTLWVLTDTTNVGNSNGWTQLQIGSVSSNLPEGVVSGSSQLSGTTITNLTITNLTTVNQTASVVFSSGSNRFGDAGNDTHSFTGSVQISGSLTTIGVSTATSFNGAINSTNGVVSGSSQVIGILSSLNTYTGSNDTTNTTQNSRLDQLSTASGSAITRLTALEVETANLEIFSGSQLSKDTTLATYTASVDGRFSTLATTTGSLQTSVTNLNTTTASLNISVTNLNTFSSSTLTRLTEIGVVSGSLITSASAAKTTNDSQGVSITNLNSATASLLIETANLESFTSSINTTIKTRLNAETVVSGSGQINVASTTGDIALGTRTSGNYVAVISGSANQITVAGSGLESAVVTLSLPQNIHTSANPQFNSLGIGTAASTVAGEIRATADITAFYSSDIRLKENINPIPNALEKLNQISGNTYDWKEGYDEVHSHKGNDVGVIAQEIEQILPQIVTNRDNGFKAVQYEKIIPLLIQAIKELSAKVDRLENK